MRQSLKTGALYGGLALAWEALAVLPGRITIGRHQAQYGRSPLEFTVAGTLRDVSDLALPLGAVLLVVLALPLFTVREPKRRRATWTTIAVALGVLGAVVWLTSSSAAEFKIQRGVDATRFDVEMGARNATIGVENIVRFLMMRRHWVPAFGVSAVAGALAAFVRPRAVSWTTRRPLAVLAGYAAVTAAGWVLALVPLDPNVRVFSTLSDRHIVGEPFVNLVRNFGYSQENVRLGLKGMIEHATFPPDTRPGEPLLGVPTYGATTDCKTHPMARSLPELGVEKPLPGARGHRPLDAKPARVLQLLDQLSAELYEGRAAPIDLYQVMLESFRGDDIHAISPSAPRELAPFTASLYESAEKGTGSVIAVHRVWQAGSRTSQGFSSYLCGMGMLPYGLSITRDFGLIPLRCLTDVLVDAGFDASFFYGGPPSFDEMDTFLRGHGVRHVVGRQQLPPGLPTSEGGVSDRALVVEAARSGARAAANRAQYTLIMTTSNHVPYRRPDDVPSDVDTRVEQLMASPAFGGAKDDAQRLRTFAYADRAVEDLVASVGPRLERTIFVLGADHATGDPFVWKTPLEWNRHAAHALIPFMIVFPEPLLAKVAHPERARELVRAVNEALEGDAWSENDVPLMVLTLLAHAPGMTALPQGARWHTLGGERTSPFFVPHEPRAKVLGINCVAEIFGTDEHDASLLPPETASFVNDERELYTSSPSLVPIAATLSRFLSGYATTCRDSVAR